MTLRAWLMALVLANIVLFAYGWTTRAGPTQANPARAAELEPDRIRLVPQKEAVEQGVGRKPRSCLEWGGFAAADAARAEKAVVALRESFAVEVRRTEGATSSWWVHVPPQANRRAADRVAEELRRAGETEYYVVFDDPKFANAISLGLFTTEGGALARRAQIEKLGIADVAVQARDGASTRVVLRMRGVSASALRRLEALRADFPATELKDCP